jgi:acyl-CoA synthetase (AMP-forming)/AMP-acid ligase II
LRIVDNVGYYGNCGIFSIFHTVCELIYIDIPHDGKAIAEIIVRGNAVMKGYYKDPEATAGAMRGGWFHTRDAAAVHPDGYAEIRDRLKDVIISGGENISSAEVEGVLLRQPAIQEVAILGMPDERWGEAPHAFVVLKAGLPQPKPSWAITLVVIWPELPKQRRARSRNMYFVKSSPPFPNSDDF